MLVDPDSEPAFFNYTCNLRAEKQYFLTKALPDWRHKLKRVNQDYNSIIRCRSPSASPSPASVTLDAAQVSCAATKADFDTESFIKWQMNLQNAVASWVNFSENTQIPEFEATVAELSLQQRREMASAERAEGRGQSEKG